MRLMRGRKILFWD